MDPDQVGLDPSPGPLIDADGERFGRFNNVLNLMRSEGFKVNRYKKLGIIDLFQVWPEKEAKAELDLS